jgi:hypothetical protein
LIPRQAPSAGQVITQQRRLGLLRCFATDPAIVIRPRAAAYLLLLYAQPLTRVLRLTASDLTCDQAGQTWLWLGDPPSSAISGCPCAPPASPPCASSPCRSPPPSLPDALGFHYTTATRQHVNAGAPWSRSAAGGHTPQ